MSESKSLLVTIMKWRISRQVYNHLTRFSRFVLFKPAANTMERLTLSSASIFVTKGFVYIHLFPVI